MNIVKKVIVPTGEIYVAQGDKGLLEFLTVGDYGKNARAPRDFRRAQQKFRQAPQKSN